MVYPLVSSYLTSDTASLFYKFAKNKTLSLIIAHDLNISLAV